MDADYWRKKAEEVMRLYDDGDPEIAHDREDALLAEFVEVIANEGREFTAAGAAAAAIEECLLSKQRTRWYA